MQAAYIAKHMMPKIDIRPAPRVSRNKRIGLDKPLDFGQ
jgi:hypothetical protein